jgi:hypothetical protein
MASQKIDQATELAERYGYDELRMLVVSKKKVYAWGTLVVIPVIAAFGWMFWSFDRLVRAHVPISITDILSALVWFVPIVVCVWWRWRQEDRLYLYSEALLRKTPLCGNCGQRLPESRAMEVALQAQRSPVQRPEL